MDKRKYLIKIISALIIIALFLCLLGCNRFDNTVTLSESELLDKLQASLVKIYVYDFTGTEKIGQGTGFYVNNIGGLITNSHVVQDSFYAKTITNKNVNRKLERVFCYDFKTSDYCYCSDFNKTSSPVEFCDNYKKGDTVFAIGYPEDSNELVVTRGQIIDDVYIDGIHYIENTAEIHPGSSGGVLVNASGYVIGVTSCKLSNNNYGAIPYNSFEEKLQTKTSKTYMNSFHSTREVNLSGYYASTYFLCSLDEEDYMNYGQPSHTYTVTIKPSVHGMYTKYLYSSIALTVELSVTYYATVNRSESYKEIVKKRISFSIDSSTVFPIKKSVRISTNYTTNLTAISAYCTPEIVDSSGKILIIYN